MRLPALLARLALLNTAASNPLCAQNSATIQSLQIDRAVIAVASHSGAANPKVISHIDLTEPFATATQWTFVAAQDPHSPTEIEEHGPISVCLVKAVHPDCSEKFYKQTGDFDPWFETPYHLFAGKIVYAGPNKTMPLLFIELCGAQGFNGNCGVATALYRYDRASDRFVRVFQNLTGRNNNEDTRFVESGPLQGDIIVNEPTQSAPYTYWIEVYRANDVGQYTRILLYRGQTHYNNGNPLAVADSEMPAILGHFGLWKHGDALPIPPHMPGRCRELFLRSSEEWCK